MAAVLGASASLRQHKAQLEGERAMHHHSFNPLANPCSHGGAPARQLYGLRTKACSRRVTASSCSRSQSVQHVRTRPSLGYGDKQRSNWAPDPVLIRTPWGSHLMAEPGLGSGLLRVATELGVSCKIVKASPGPRSELMVNLLHRTRHQLGRSLKPRYCRTRHSRSSQSKEEVLAFR